MMWVTWLSWIAWAAGLIALYLVTAPVLLVGALLAMLTAGIIDWSGERRKRPADPLKIGYVGTPETAFGWSFETLHYPTELGPAEAWLVPADTPSSLWAIWVHGIGGSRENGYRLVKTLHEAGLPVLMITYRNDRGAPRSPDGLYSFGLSEWRDLEAAVAFALGKGAERLVIAAESMGGAITGQYLQRGSHTDRIAGLALDAPALDFNEVIAHGGRRYFVPLSEVIARVGLLLWSRLRTDLRAAIAHEPIAAFKGPIFLAHGEGDPLVPFATSARLVAVRPDIAFWRTASDQHPMSFEMDRAGYAAALRRWVEGLAPG